MQLGKSALPILLTAALVASCAPTPAPTSRVAATPGANACKAIEGLRLPDTEFVSVNSVPANTPVANVGHLSMFGTPASVPVATGLPAFCRVAGYIRPEPGSEIGFEVWMPAQGWDGRLHGVGIGGFAGSIDYYTLAMALKAGQAGVATDTGHKGMSFQSSWARGNPQKVTDYASRAIHLSTRTAKALIAAYYGEGPKRSYFVGCSGGGRQGLMQAARYPEDYDGILAGAPAASFTEVALAMTNALQAQRMEGAKLRPAQVRLLQDEVLAQCDAGDGQQDGLVADPRQCRFDASRLACGTNGSDQCFSPPQISAVKRIISGPRDSSGRQIAGGYLPAGAEVGAPTAALGWDGFLVSNGNTPTAADFLVDGILGDLTRVPFADKTTFDFDRHPEMLRAAMREIDVPYDLRHFFSRGGKLVLWHGWADAAIPPEATLRYRDAMLRASGSRAASSSRLFMVPGVQHCMGGTGPDSFGQLNAPPKGEGPDRSLVAALQDWAEGTRPAPEMIVGRHGHGGLMGMSVRSHERERLICAWPRQARLKPGADPHKAASYSCK